MLAHGPHYVWSNGNNQRVERVDSTGTTRYVYDGGTVVAETDGTGAVKAYYTPGVGFTTVSGGASQTYYWMQDALGSTTGVQDASQSRVDWMWYQAYGYTYVNRASVGTPYLFGGKHGYYADGDSGMLLLGRRYYLPSFHRFLTEDPSGHAAGLERILAAGAERARAAASETLAAVREAMRLR